MPKSPIKLKDKSGDRRYFIITPQLVWALSRTPYDYVLWDVVKMIAGEDGECMLATEDLAALAMMSVGKLVDCRKYLLKRGLLEGEIRRDPGYPQPVWHLRIPDLWQDNIAWRNELGHSLKDRIRYKKRQAKSLHQMKPSPGEGGPPPGEGGPPPGETKKNHKGEPKGEGGLVLFEHAGIEVEI